MSESYQHVLSRVRPPRVQITYDVETGGAIQQKELPFVLGVLADLAGEHDDKAGESVAYYPEDDLSASSVQIAIEKRPPMSDRAFEEIDRDVFDKRLADTAPVLTGAVDRTEPQRLVDDDGNGALAITIEIEGTDANGDPISLVGDDLQIALDAYLAAREKVLAAEDGAQSALADAIAGWDDALDASDKRGDGYADYVRGELAQVKPDEISFALVFQKVDDFDPGRVLRQIEEARSLLRQRDALVQLQTQAEGSADLADTIGYAIRDSAYAQFDTDLSTDADNDDP